MKKRLINTGKLLVLYKKDYGIKSFCDSFLKKEKGYNLRYRFRHIKKEDLESIVLKLEEQAEDRAIEADESGTKKLKSEVRDFIQYKVYNCSYEGERHEKNLPVRGQRTRTNARNSKIRGYKLPKNFLEQTDDINQ